MDVHILGMIAHIYLGFLSVFLSFTFNINDIRQFLFLAKTSYCTYSLAKQLQEATARATLKLSQNPLKREPFRGKGWEVLREWKNIQRMTCVPSDASAPTSKSVEKRSSIFASL